MMATHIFALWALFILFVSSIEAWTPRWDLSKRFKAAGHKDLECDGSVQPVSCCLCNSVVFEIETQLNNTVNDYELDVVFRISEEKKKIKYSRSEARILEVLDQVCSSIPSKLSNIKKKSLVIDACNAFVGEYEDELTRTFFNDFRPARERICASTIKVCTAPKATKANRDDL